MTNSDDAGLYARSFGDVYDDWYGRMGDPADVVDALILRCAPGARVVELGSGTGRLATPLAHAGFCVVALDVSYAMLRRADGRAERLVSDMAATAVRSSCAGAVLIAYNTLFNVTPIDRQGECLHEAARMLSAAGVLAIEAFVAPPASASDGSPHYGVSAQPHPTVPDARLVMVTGYRPDDGGIVGSHIELLADATVCRPWRLAYQSPEQLDRTASLAGLELVERCRDWTGAPFDPDGDRHVSWYRRAGP